MSHRPDFTASRPRGAARDWNIHWIFAAEKKMNFKESPKLSAVVKAACLLSTYALFSVAHAAQPPAEILIPGRQVVPESLTSDRNGAIYVGSIVERTIYRAQPGASQAEPWIGPETEGMQNVLGVLADDASNTLWACSSPNTPQAGEPSPPQAALYAFDLKTRALKGKYPFPTQGAVCNDIAIDSNGAAYATDTANMQVVRLMKGAKSLDVWSTEGAFGPTGGVLDGIAILGKTLYVNTLASSKLFAVPIGRDGKAGTTTEVQLDRALDRPDGMRSFGRNSLLVVEGGGPGRLSKVVLEGNGGKVTTLKEGYPDNAVAVTVVGETGYVLEAQFKARRDPAYVPKPFRATAVPVGKP